MSDDNYTLDDYVEDLRGIRAEAGDDREIISRVRPLARRLALAKTWLGPEHYECNQEQGFGVHLLHEEPDHSLAVFAVSWLPGRGAPPHNHGTWAVVAGVDGPEENSFWDRVDDGSREGYAELSTRAEKEFEEGEVVALEPEHIHSVTNRSDRVTVSLHTYGMHVNHTGRSQFDIENNREIPFTVVEQ
jgi:predicted metal-dependent enzyme (double-stranded beta helix superfamily)